MKLKLDENLPLEVAELLAAASHDVHTVTGEKLTGQRDEIILRAAANEGRLLVTQDLDFSDVRQFSPGTHPGIVLIRLRHPSRQQIIERVKHVLLSESIESWAGCFVVISDRKLRIRRS